MTPSPRPIRGRRSNSREYIQFYIEEYPGLNELDELQKLLEERNYFKDNDFPSLRLKTLISYKKGDYSGIISEIEALRKGISFVKKEQQADYTTILLMLVDSYYSTKLLTAAETIAAELYKEQPDNPDVLWRVLRVQKILGDEGAPDRELNEKLAVVEKSRFLTVTKPNATYDVYLFNQPWIEITLDPGLARPAQAQAARAGVRGRQDRLRKLCRRLAGEDRHRAEVRRDREQGQSTDNSFVISEK